MRLAYFPEGEVVQVGDRLCSPLPRARAKGVEMGAEVRETESAWGRVASKGVAILRRCLLLW